MIKLFMKLLAFTIIFNLCIGASAYEAVAEDPPMSATGRIEILGDSRKINLPRKDNQHFDGSELIAEIKMAEANSDWAQLDVTDIAKKYIKAGFDSDAVLQNLASSGFTKWSKVDSRIAEDKQVFSYSYYRGFWNRLVGFNHEIRIVILTNSSKISNVKAFVFFHAI